MSPQRTRILWASRYYWPFGAGRHARAAATVDLTRRLSEAGHHVEVVTPRYGTHWSEGFRFHNIAVHRIAAAPRGEWSIQRYVRHLGNWMIEQSGRFDVLVCDGLNDDARAIINAVTGQGRAVPIGVTLCDGWGGDADEVACRQSRSGRRILSAVSAMNHVVTRHAGADRFLIAQGIPPDAIHRTPKGFARPQRVTAEQRAAARGSLGQANSDLTAGPDDRVLLWCGDMKGRPRDQTGVIHLVANARLMCGRYPNLRIWLLGDGELHDWVHTELKAEGVRSVVAIPGSFADMSDVWKAVDFAVVTDEDQLRYTLPSAIERGIPVLLNELPTIRSWIGEHFQSNVAESFAWYDQHRGASLRKNFRMMWDDFSGTAEHAWQVALEAAHHRSESEEIQQWSSIFQRSLGGAGL
ncbi:hypothetical protein Pla100_21480 [Neorhodopirellula pilleata]|uniref:Glycosyltransferase subfamily 4-like N-terminal domain-containing protein n=2 Tax=Neorhodopirellula pilleata TaxID=2714738 RepID=A0A5C6AG24_9BACT|nr:hypothetical protein Pla100_21480 [Neorhodopirellula pilleata]